jgi:drug/metabolite transporter superfamily protein YnfA
VAASGLRNLRIEIMSEQRSEIATEKTSSVLCGMLFISKPHFACDAALFTWISSLSEMKRGRRHHVIYGCFFVVRAFIWLGRWREASSINDWSRIMLETL